MQAEKKVVVAHRHDSHSSPATATKPSSARRSEEPAEPTRITKMPVDFVNDIKPILQRSCVGCHNGKEPKGSFRVTSRALIFQGGKSGETAIMLRDPTANPYEVKGWHWDPVREYDRRTQIDVVSALMYLTDVTQTDHCYSIVLEIHNRLVDINPIDVAPDADVDVMGPAGTAVIFHARAIHSGRLKSNSTQRQTLQAYYSRWRNQRTAEWSEILPRLHQKQAPHYRRSFMRNGM